MKTVHVRAMGNDCEIKISDVNGAKVIAQLKEMGFVCESPRTHDNTFTKMIHDVDGEKVSDVVEFAKLHNLEILTHEC